MVSDPKSPFAGEAVDKEPTMSALDASSREEFDRELLGVRAQAELLHNGIALWMTAIGGLVFFLTTLLPGGGASRGAPLGWADRGIILAIFAALISWFAVVRRPIRRLVREKLPPPRYARHITAVMEALFPSAICLYLELHSAAHPSRSLYSPFPFGYFLFVVLSTVRLDRGLCIFTGSVMAGCYGLLVLVGWATDVRMYGVSDLELPPEIAKAVLIFLAGWIAGYIAEYVLAQNREMVKRLIKESRLRALFGQHVSAKVVEAIERTNLATQTTTRKVCVMFLDIRGFTAFSEGKSPEEVVRYLNTLFSFMVDVIDRRRGVVNKFLGDGFMAVFGAPVSLEDPCLEAVETAREIVARVEELEATNLIPSTRVGIGLHYGEALTGFVGTETRREYTVIGDVVNVASRVESLNKELGSSLLISEEVLQALPSRPPEAVAKGPVQVKGRKQPVTVWQLG